MQLRNNYEKDIFNGDIGLIHTIDIEDQKLEIIFNGKIVHMISLILMILHWLMQ